MKYASDADQRKRNFDGLRSRTRSYLDHYFGLPQGIPVWYSVRRISDQLYSDILGCAEQGLRAMRRQDAWFSAHGLDSSAAFWSESFEMIIKANEQIIGHHDASRVDLAVIRRLARLLSSLTSYVTIVEDEVTTLHAKALQTLLTAFADDRVLKAVSNVAAKSSPPARSLLEKVLAAAPPVTSHNRNSSLPARIGRAVGVTGIPKALDRLFTSVGCHLPTIPKTLASQLRKIDDTCFATRTVRVGPENLGEWLHEAATSVVADCVVISRNATRVFGNPQDSLSLFMVLGPLRLFVVVPVPSAPGVKDDPDEGRRALLLLDTSDLIREAERAIARGTICTPDNDFFVVILDEQVAWFQGGVPEPENFDAIAGHYEDQLPLISAWLKAPRRAGVRPHQIRPGNASTSSWNSAIPQWHGSDDRDTSRDDGHIPSFEPRGRISKPPQIDWVEVFDWSETRFQGGVNVHIRAADHDLGELVARVEGFNWREKPGSKTRVHVLPVTSGRGSISERIYPEKTEAAHIRRVVAEWFRDGARASDFGGLVFQEAE